MKRNLAVVLGPYMCSIFIINFRYLDLVLIHYPKAENRDNDDTENAKNRKDFWLALENIPGKFLKPYDRNLINETTNHGIKNLFKGK